MRQCKGVIAVVSSAILFGLMPLVANLAYAAGLNAITLTIHRFLFGIPALFVLARFKGVTLKITKAESPTILLLSLGAGLTPLLIFTSYHYIPSGIAMALHFIYPILVILACAIFFGEKMHRIQIISCILCFIGIFSFRTAGNHLSLLGLCLAVASGFTYAFYILMLRKTHEFRIHNIKLSFYMALVSVLLMVGIGVLSRKILVPLVPSAYLYGLILGIMTSVLATLLFQEGSKVIGAPNAALFSTAEPVVSIIVGVVFLQEVLSFQMVIGMVLILISIFLLTLYERNQQLQRDSIDALKMKSH